MKKKKGASEIILKGIPCSAGVVIGPAFIFADKPIEISRVLSENKNRELEKFKSALKKVTEDIRHIKEETESSYGAKMAGLFDLQLGLLEDEILITEIEKKILEEKLTAAYSVFEVLYAKKEHFLNLSNEYFRDRASEIQSLKRKLIDRIENKSETVLADKPAIIVAHDLTPADTMKMIRNNVLGFITETGGVNSHAAIMGRALGVPSVAGCVNALSLIETKQTVIVDGIEGIVIVNPDSKTIEKYKLKAKNYKSFEEKVLKEVVENVQTTDNRPIKIYANIEFVEELESVRKYKANGVGLYRTESLFMGRESLPSEAEQTEVYTQLAESVYPNNLTIRTIDVGGDKILPEVYSAREDNPFLGWRAIRFCMDNPEIFLTQLKAILRANRKNNIRIMIPMISSVHEIEFTRNLLNEAFEILEKENKAPVQIPKLGIMVETPAAAVLLSAFKGLIDFASIGTNDLTQYVLTVDRTNEKVAGLYSPFHPAVLLTIKNIISSAYENNIEVEMCGEMAGNPIAIPLLIGLRLQHFSMSPVKIPEAQQIISRLSYEECNLLAQETLTKYKTEDVLELLNDFFSRKFKQFIF